MVHSNENLIWKVNLGDKVYDIHDSHAVHTLADLADLGMNTEGIFVFKGTVATVSNLPTTDNKIGYVYHVTANHSEYIWAKVDDNGAEGWEEFGEHFVINHVHPVTVTGTNTASAVTGSATVTGGNSASNVTGSASITNAPKVEVAAKYAKVSTGNDTFVKSYPGATSKMVTASVTSAGAATSVVSSVTPSTGSITGVSGSVAASKATASTALAGAKVGSAVTVATGLNEGSVTAGQPASWSASVTDGVLEFNFSANTPTAVTLPTAKTTSITPAAELAIPQYTFSDVTVPVAASATTVVTAVSSKNTDVATVGSAVTVATGALANNGAGASVMTGLGTANTAPALISASLATGTSSDGIHTGDDVTVSTQTLSGTIDGTAAAQVWTQNTGSISGTAAAQVWAQTSGITGIPTEE